MLNYPARGIGGGVLLCIGYTAEEFNPEKHRVDFDNVQPFEAITMNHRRHMLQHIVRMKEQAGEDPSPWLYLDAYILCVKDRTHRNLINMCNMVGTTDNKIQDVKIKSHDYNMFKALCSIYDEWFNTDVNPEGKYNLGPDSLRLRIRTMIMTRPGDSHIKTWSAILGWDINIRDMCLEIYRQAHINVILIQFKL